ncbi:MAG: IS630 family transposase, partial [Candidatus Bathyarchaeia archaeon]
GRKPKLNRKDERVLLKAAIKNPRKLEWYAKHKLKLEVSRSQLRKILLKHGLRFRRDRLRLVSKDPCYEAKKLRIQRLVKKPNCTVLFQDEKCLVAKAYSGYEWCFKARVIPLNQRIKGKYYLFLFYDPHRKKIYRFYFDRASKSNFLRSLKLLSKRVKDRIYLILDNSIIHKLRRDEIPTNVKLVFLPTYSPELNLIEPIFSLIEREILWNQRFKSIEEVKQSIDKWIRARLFSLQISSN